MFELLSRYARWLHTGWPAGTIERLPEVMEDGSTNVPGVFVIGDLRGVPLLKFALDSGARVARTLAAERAQPIAGHPIVIIGAGVSGLAAAVEARKLGLPFEIIESTEPLSTLIDFPRAKPIFTYPTRMIPAGDLNVRATSKEELVAELRAQVDRAGIRPIPGRARRVTRRGRDLLVLLEDGTERRATAVVVAIGKSGAFRKLGVIGEDRDHVFHRLHDPAEFEGKRVLVVGGGDTAVETAIALTLGGAHVTLAHRGDELTRPKPENQEKLSRLLRDPSADVAIEHPTSELVSTAYGGGLGSRRRGSLSLRLGTRVTAIEEGAVVLAQLDGGSERLASDAVFTMIGRDPPNDFFRRSGLRVRGERRAASFFAMALFLAFCAWLYDWKSGGWFGRLWAERQWFPFDVPRVLASLGPGIAAAARDRSNPIGTLAISAAAPAFWYTLAYSIVVLWFGARRIRRRRTPYVTAQTLCLMAFQVLPLFLLPELILPLLDARGWLPRGLSDALFPVVSYGHGREFWRAYGLVLAWPLNVYNVFTPHPLPWWIVISIVQTLVLIPLAVFFFGKGAYCGWICSCGALAETLGDTHRHKMPHGPGPNRLNLAGQVVLGIAVVLLVVRIVGWVDPGGRADALFEPILKAPYQWTIDVFLAGVIGYGLYFWFSGRVWCRFFCPLAALMHVYARLGRFAIVPDKKRCISCNVCTSVCHQGIDVMSFANKGAPMRDPQCVRCSACVERCPTGVLQFGQVDARGELIALDRLAASPVLMRERPAGPALTPRAHGA